MTARLSVTHCMQGHELKGKAVECRNGVTVLHCVQCTHLVSAKKRRSGINHIKSDPFSFRESESPLEDRVFAERLLERLPDAPLLFEALGLSKSVAA